MALADITLNDGASTPVAHIFTYVNQVGNRVIRSDFAAPAEEPRTMTIAHSSAKKSGVNVSSHLVRFDEIHLDSDGVTPHAVNIRVMIDMPDPVRSDTTAKNLAAFIRNYFSEVNVINLIKGSVG